VRPVRDGASSLLQQVVRASEDKISQIMSAVAARLRWHAAL
jgi:hypothetical protein